MAAFLIAAVLGRHPPLVGAEAAAASLGPRAGAVLAAVAGLSLLLYPSLVHYGEKNTRLQIERDHAPLVLRQPQWREYVLASAQRRIDSLRVLEEAPPGPYPPDIEELAFAVWSTTDLAAFGFTSAVEIQDVTGAVISRFALNLPPSLDRPRPATPLPASEAWEVSRERLTVASEQRPVLHARRLLTYHSEMHGAIHLFVGEDFWNLPFITARDPYSVLHRTTSGEATRDRPITLLVYGPDGDVLFSSAERPPALHAGLAARVGGPNRVAFWTGLTVDGRAHNAYLFSEDGRIYALAYPRLEPVRYAAGLVEAAGGLTLIGLALLAVVIVLRSLLGRRTLSFASITRSVEARFALRLFVAFTLLAFVPVAVLQVVVRGFVADRLSKESENQALERAAIAKKAVEQLRSAAPARCCRARRSCSRTLLAPARPRPPSPRRPLSTPLSRHLPPEHADHAINDLDAVQPLGRAEITSAPGDLAWIDELSDRPIVYVTMGTIYNRDASIFQTILAGLVGHDVSVVVTVGRDNDPAMLGPQPAHVVVRRFVPQAALLPRARWW